MYDAIICRNLLRCYSNEFNLKSEDTANQISNMINSKTKFIPIFNEDPYSKTGDTKRAMWIDFYKDKSFQVFRCMDVCEYVCEYVCVDVCVCVCGCVYVCMYVCIEVK